MWLVKGRSVGSVAWSSGQIKLCLSWGEIFIVFPSLSRTDPRNTVDATVTTSARTWTPPCRCLSWHFMIHDLSYSLFVGLLVVLFVCLLLVWLSTRCVSTIHFAASFCFHSRWRPATFSLTIAISLTHICCWKCCLLAGWSQNWTEPFSWW